MNINEAIREPVQLEGAFYTLPGLRAYCREQSADSSVPAWRKELFSFLGLFLDPGGAPVLQKSSGSTGDPKSFILSREAMIRSAGRTIRYFNLRRGDRVLLALPVHYIAGKMMLVRALLGGLDLLLVEPSSRPLQHIGVPLDFAAMVPLQIEESLQYGDPLERIAKLLIGGGELHPATRGRLSTLSTPQIYESFGMTETYTHFALRRINGRKADPFFKLLEGVQIGLDSRGCLEVELSGITSGRLITNDLVKIHPGEHGFTWLGRFDNLINSGGIKIIPEVLEEQIRECLGHECLVLSEPDRKLGNRLVLLVEYPDKRPPLDKWLEQLSGTLSSYEIPRRILTTSSIPRNSSMKPDRTSARKLLL
ncbi:MAG: AMP-binding protein [Bacteroidales bacterium]|nr:AMP-binding protein [Bacteroidales bacterium]